MRERDIEQHLVTKTAALGGVAYKFVSPSTAGACDRLVLLPVPPEHRAVVQRYVKLVEVKAPNERPRPLQTWFMERIQALGHCATWVASKEAVDEVLQ